MAKLAFLNRLLRNPKGRRVAKYAGIFGLVLLGLELAYVLVANIALSTDVIRNQVGSAEGIQLMYSAAHSWLPGRVQVSGLVLRVEDYNVQFELDIERAKFHVTLHDLLSKRFHATRLRADGLAFRMRHKVHAVGSKAARLAAYPPIQGFADPPLYRGPPPPPTSNPQALWSIQIEDVQARIKELWVLEYRFRGDAEARGSFLLRPALEVRVQPAELEFHAGSLHAGAHTAAQQLTGTLSFDMPKLDVQSSQGQALFGGMSAGAKLELAGVELDFLNLYLGKSAALQPRGTAHVRLRADVKQGALTNADSALDAPHFTLAAGAGELVGKAHITAIQPGAHEPLTLEAKVDSATYRSRCETPATFKNLEASLKLTRVDFTQPIQSGAMSGSGSLRAPDIACFDALVSNASAQRHLGGSARGSIKVDRDSHGQGDGQAELDVENGTYQAGDTQFHSALHSTARFRFDEDKDGTPYAQGAVSLRLSDAESLLSVAVAPLFKKLIAGTLAMDKLSATVAFHAERDALQLALTRAKSGAVDAKGHLHLPLSGPQASQGAILLSTGPIHVGVKIEGDHTSVEPLVSEDWLASDGG